MVSVQAEGCAPIVRAFREGAERAQPWERAVTIADGLPCGLHELTLAPVQDRDPSRMFVISGVEVHRPPLARDVAEATKP